MGRKGHIVMKKSLWGYNVQEVEDTLELMESQQAAQVQKNQHLESELKQLREKLAVLQQEKEAGRLFVGRAEDDPQVQARLEALTRRIKRGGVPAKPAGEQEQLISGPFVLDEKSRMLYKNGTAIDLTQVEFQIMELFFRNPGIALVREKILKGVWGENYFGDVKIVDVNIRRLRMKVEDEPSHPTHILTVWGYGYRWEE